MKLILTGGGIGEKAKTAFSLFAKEVNGGEILYLPFAEEEMTIDENVEWFSEQIKPYGITKITVIKTAKELTKEKIDKSAGIFIGGGNSFSLLKQLKENNRLHLIQNALQSEKVILGLSAGATIFEDDINSCIYDEFKIIATDKNNVKLKDTKGIGIFSGYSLFVHYKLSQKQLVATQQKVEKILAGGQNVIGLPEESCLYVTENEVIALGEKPIEVITKDKVEVYHHNQKVNLKINNKFYLQEFKKSLNFSLASLDDLEKIMALYKDVIKNTFTTWDKYYPSRDLIKEDILNENLYVLKNKNEVLGVSFLGKTAKAEKWTIPLSSPMSVARICVSPSCQGLGLGSMFLNHLIDKAKSLGADGMHFHVCTINPSAMRMYEKAGFKNCGLGQSNYGFDYFKYEQKFDN